jgi:hypothetical protein
VSSTIVDYLSSGLYRTPAACLKELINNSYDADARNVRVFVKPDAERIIVDDDGLGLDRGEFEAHFRRIAESRKRDASDRTTSGRPMIGKIGIGFVAANEICDEIEIISTKAGSQELLHVRIDFARMRSTPSERRSPSGDVAKADYEGDVSLDAAESDHYTRVFLNRVRGEARQILAGAMNTSGGQSTSLYGLKAESVRDVLCKFPFRSWQDLDAYSDTMLRVGLYTPVRYAPNWMPQPLRRKVRQFEEAAERLDFSVSYDGTDVRRPIVFCPDGRVLLETFKFQGDSLSATGYFYVEHGALTPQDLTGVLIRIRHAAVGEYDPTFLDFPTSIGAVFQRWISAEIWASDELEDALNIDRRTLRVTHPAYVELRSAVHAQMHRVIARARAELYGAGSRERRTERASATTAAIDEVVDRVIRPVDSAAADRVRAAWQPDPTKMTPDPAVLRRYTVPELYEVVLSVASDVLPPRLRASFIDALTRRLRK